MLAILQAAGWPIWPLFIASVIAVGIIIERFISLRQARILPPGLFEQVQAEIKRGNMSREVISRIEAGSPLGRVLAAGLRNQSSNRDVMKDAIEETGSAVANELERFLTTLGTIASIAPLMGLFGTVVGMIEIFGSQQATGSDPISLAHGLSTALYNTGFGILVAIPALIFWRHFRSLVNSYLVKMEQLALHLVEIQHGDRH